jgi:hypothetical protein
MGGPHEAGEIGEGVGRNLQRGQRSRRRGGFPDHVADQCLAAGAQVAPDGDQRVL